MSRVTNPAIEIQLPGGYVMPNTAPVFDYVKLIPEILLYLRRVQATNQDYDKFYGVPQLNPGKFSQDALLQFTDDYMIPAARIMHRVFEVDEYQKAMNEGTPPKNWYNTVNHPEPVRVVDLHGDEARDRGSSSHHRDVIDVVPAPISYGGRIPPGQISSYTRQKMNKLTAYLKSRKYDKKISTFSDILSYVEFIPTRQNKNRREHFPEIAFLVTPARTFVLDIFLAGERLSTFNYGLPTYNQIVAPRSMIGDNFDGSLEPKEFYQYKLGMEQAVIKIEAAIRSAVQKAAVTKDAPIKSAF